MRLGRTARIVLAVVTGLILVAIYVPLMVVLVNSFSTSTSLTWPPPGFTLEWWGKAFESAGAREAVLTSVQVAVVATVISLVLGTLISIALQRFEFFGRDAISLLIILPIYAGLERVPDSLLEASADLGGKTWRTLGSVVLPLVFPAIIAGTIFSFSLSLGDYITVNIVGGANQMLGNLVYTNVGAANNLPLAAAIALIPIVIIFGYLAIVRRTGALNNL